MEINQFFGDDEQLLDYIKETYSISDLLEIYPEKDKDKFILGEIGYMDREDVLNELGEHSIIDYLEDRDYLIFRTESDLEDYYKQNLENNLFDDHDSFVSTLRKKDSFQVMMEIVKKVGWNRLFEILSGIKEKI